MHHDFLPLYTEMMSRRKDLNIKYIFLAYLKMGVYCLTLPYQFVELVAQNLMSSEIRAH